MLSSAVQSMGGLTAKGIGVLWQNPSAFVTGKNYEFFNVLLTPNNWTVGIKFAA